MVGRLSDRTRTPLGRRRPFFLVGVPLMAISLLTLALHPPFWVMLALMTIGSFFLAVAGDPYLALMADLFPPALRGRVGGLLGLTSALAAITITLLSSFFWAQYEGLVFLFTISILVVSFAITFFTVREPPLPATPPAPTGPRQGPGAYIAGCWSIQRRPNMSWPSLSSGSAPAARPPSSPCLPSTPCRRVARRSSICPWPLS